MDQLTDFVLEFAADHQIQPDTFFGVAEGATKLGVLTQFKYAMKNTAKKAITPWQWDVQNQKNMAIPMINSLSVPQKAIFAY